MSYPRKMVKVRVIYEDGQTWVEPYCAECERLNLPYAEMREEEWNAYQDHRVQCWLWGRLMRELDEAQYRMQEERNARG